MALILDTTGVSIQDTTGTAIEDTIGPVTVAMSFSPAMAAAVTVSGPYTSTVAMGFSPAMAATVGVANPVTATAAMSFRPAMAASASSVPQVAASVAMSFNPAMAASASSAEPKLIMSIAPNSGTDEFGNPYLQGFHLYNEAGTRLSLQNNGSFGSNPTIGFTPAGVTNVTSDITTYGYTNNPGAANQYTYLIHSSGKTNGQSDAAIQLQSAPGDNSAQPLIIFEFGGNIYATMSPGFGLQADTWHSASLSNSWTGSGSGVNGLSYKLTPFNEVEVIADIINTTATGNSTCFTLPSGYRPIGGTKNFPAGWNNPVTSNSASVPWVTVLNTGVIQITGIESANKQIFFHIFIPLDI